MKRLTLAILMSAVSMVAVLVVFDVYQLISTPLSSFGVNHWILELLTVFLVGRWLPNETVLTR